jgi:hypothetical protein
LELRKNVIVAIHPNKQWFLDNPGEPRENFWLEKNFITLLFSERYLTTTPISGRMVCQ